MVIGCVSFDFCDPYCSALFSGGEIEIETVIVTANEIVPSTQSGIWIWT